MFDVNGQIVACQQCAAKAQARHLLKILDEPCEEHGYGRAHRRDCPRCMAEIKKEVGE